MIRRVIALLEDAHPRELHRAKERIVECRQAWDQWRAVLADTESGSGGEPNGAARVSGESSTGGRVVGAEECALRGRYELAKTRIVHFGAFEFRPEWSRERRQKRMEGNGRTENSPASGDAAGSG